MIAFTIKHKAYYTANLKKKKQIVDATRGLLSLEAGVQPRRHIQSGDLWELLNL